MSKYIDAEELLAWYDDFRKHEREILSENYHKERKDEARIKISTLDKVYFKVQELKDNAADVEEVRHGKWMDGKYFPFIPKKGTQGFQTATCSRCNITQSVNTYQEKVKFNYCPYCGARMGGKGKTDV